jgi:hypothetical protein
MKIILLLLSILFCQSAFTSNLLIIGDSHMSGPFGIRLHSHFNDSEKFSNVITYGHASSSSIHWMNDSLYKLSGGVFHQFNNLLHPSPTHWRTKVEVPKLKKVIDSRSLHEEWGVNNFRFDAILIALGANDARAISSQEGVVNTWEYKKRQSYVIKMVELIKKNNLRCFWVAPPNGIKKTKENQDVLYKMLKEVVLNNCDFFSSNHYKAIGCDGIHFNCRSELKNAHKWAKEVFKFIDAKL